VVGNGDMDNEYMEIDKNSDILEIEKVRSGPKRCTRCIAKIGIPRTNWQV
jgi:hypothetical protein